MGYPKAAVITGNIFYGGNVTDEEYESISDDVKTYGTVFGNTYSETVGEYAIPESGIRK